MLLYEFDAEMPKDLEKERKQLILDFLEGEAYTQGWKKGYRLRKIKEYKLENMYGEKTRHFLYRVYGSYYRKRM